MLYPGYFICQNRMQNGAENQIGNMDRYTRSEHMSSQIYFNLVCIVFSQATFYRVTPKIFGVSLKFCCTPACDRRDAGVLKRLKRLIKGETEETAKGCGLLGAKFQRPRRIFGVGSIDAERTLGILKINKIGMNI